MEALGRAGWAARALLYLVTAVLVTRVASAGGNGAGDDEASQTGALREIGEQPFGKALLAVLAVGLLAFAAWRLLTAWRGAGGDGNAERVGHIASGLVYAGFGVLAGMIVLRGESGGGDGGDQHARSLTARILAWPLGPWLVGAVGLGVIAIGGYFFWSGLSRNVADNLELGRVSRGGRRAIVAIGVVGQCARGAVFAVVGWFVVKAAVEFDPNEARGLDSALRELAESSWGIWLLWAVAVGLGAYALFCLIRARYDRRT